MHNHIIGIALVALACSALFASCKPSPRDDSKTEPALIFPKGEKITNDNFTGNAWLQPLIAADNDHQNTVGNVTFAAGARSKWHLHPAGQILLVIDGVGYYQEKGRPKKILRKGDAIKCPPNVAHWHGASANESFTQLAITGREKERLYGWGR